MGKVFVLLKKSILYFILTCLIIISLAVAGVYLFQDKIIGLTFQEINKHLNTKIEVDKDVQISIFKKFPEISIEIKNVKVYENVPGSTDKLADIKSLYFTFNAYDFIQGRYVINNIYAESGDIRLKIDKNGFANYNIFKTDSSSEKNISLDLKKIILSDIMVSYTSLLSDQDHQLFIKNIESKLKLEEKTWFISMNGDLLIRRIGIGSSEYLKEKEVAIISNQEFHEETQLFKILPSVLGIEGSEFKLSGFYEGKDKNNIDLNLKAKASTISTLLSLMPENLRKELSVYESTGNVIFEASVKGLIKADKNPHVNVNFGFNNATFYHPEFNRKIQNATLKGSFSNGASNNLSSSSLKLRDVSATLDQKVFSGNFEMENFDDPFLKFNILGNIDVSSLIEFYPIDRVTRASGNLDIDLSFEGKKADLISKEGREKITAQGKINISDLNVLLKKPAVDYKEINGNISFNKSDVEIKELSGKIGKSDFKVDGSFKNFITKLFFDKEKMGIEANITSNHINFDELVKIFTSDSSYTSTNNPKGPYPYLEDYKFKLNCDIKNFVFRKFHAKELLTSIQFDQPSAKIKNTSMTLAGGKVKLNSDIEFKSKERIEINTQSSLSTIQIDSLFYIFENFNQDFLVDKNLKGQFTGDFQVFFAMDNAMNVNSSSVIATIDASIKNGELNNFEPMKKLSRFIDEEKLENIKFSELKNKIYIENGKTVIPEMEIKSNISNITVMGTHTFDQHIDYKLTVPLKNFKKKPTSDKDEAFGAIEADNRGNSLIFLTIKGTTDDYKIAYDKKRTAGKIKEGLKNEGKEIEQLFKNKKPVEPETTPDNSEPEFFDF